MKLNKTLTLIAIAAATLCASSQLQAQDAAKDKPAEAQTPPGAPPQRRPMMNVDGIIKQLVLTDDQSAKAKPILEDWLKNMQAARKDLRAASAPREEVMAKMKELHDAATLKLKDILTAEQLAKWEKVGQGNRRPTVESGKPAPSTPDAAQKN